MPSDRAVGAYYPAVRQSTLRRRRALFDEALGVIARDYPNENLSLGVVARAIATSRRQLQRVFAEHDTSFRSELQHVRMRRAAQLLRDGELPVSMVARAVGYRHPAQFSKAFRRHHGLPPSELRAASECVAA
jgi:AraC family transcriptional regulator, regulatory protein of adaptative response / methylphosphotriester-DNA alkyltransferase methyltransferase